MMRRSRIVSVGVAIALAAGFLTLSSVSPTPASAALPTLTNGFTDQTLGFTGLSTPTAMKFAPDGKVFVAEKRGVVQVYASVGATVPTQVIDLRTSVYNFWDRGLLGMAIDPNYLTGSPYIYVLYTYDHQLGEAASAPHWGVANGDAESCDHTSDKGGGCLASARLSRFPVNTTTGVASGPEQPLVEDWCQQFPSHSIGSLNFGADGYLYADAGDAASFVSADEGAYGDPTVLLSDGTHPKINPCNDPGTYTNTFAVTNPNDEGGAFRAQSIRRPSNEPVSLDGTIIRIDKTTGAGAPGNPYAASANANAKRIIANGLRNPFRSTFKPGTNDMYIGDVGWSTWEEINRIPNTASAGQNFGWPCYEGDTSSSVTAFSSFNVCSTLLAAGTSAVAAPLLAYKHQPSASEPDMGATNGLAPCDSSSASGSAIAGVAFYTPANGYPNPYPTVYNDALFFADYARNCIAVMFSNGAGSVDPTTRVIFASAAAGPVDLQAGPGGDIFYVSLNGNSIHRIVYTQNASFPVAVISTTPNPPSGTAPLTVNFDASQSSAPNGHSLSYWWDFTSDGTWDNTFSPSPPHVYAQGTFTAKLRVTDTTTGLTNDATITVNSSNSPPTPVITSPAAGATFKVGDTINFAGAATDQQDGTLSAAKLSWQVDLHHCGTGPDCATGGHIHPLTTINGAATGSVGTIDHAYPSYLQIILTATDSNGASTSTSVIVRPQASPIKYLGPPGTQFFASGNSNPIVAGSTYTWITGGSEQVLAPDTTMVGSDIYHFFRWSDGDMNPRSMSAPPGGTTVTAQYKRFWHGYYLVAGDGGVFTFGDARFYGSTGNIKLNKPVVGMDTSSSGDGYYLVAADGGIFTFGDAQFFGSTGNIKLNAPVIGMTMTQTGNGYWLFAADGGVFTYGDAPFLGSTGNVHLSSPVIGMAAKKDASGYWLFAADGTVYPFGTAAKLSGAAIPAGKQVAAMGPTASGNGYWLATTDGNVYPFGDAANLGGVGNLTLSKPIVGMMVTPTGHGYWLLAGDGGVFTFGDATFFGSTGNLKLNSPVVSGAGGLG